MNNVNLIGTMVRDIDLKQYKDKTRGLIRIAVNNNYKNANGEYDSNFFTISVWGSTAEYIAKYAPKGSTIAITARLDNYTKEDDNGNSYELITIEATNVEIIKKPKAQQELERSPYEYGEQVAQKPQPNPTQNNNYPSNDSEIEPELPF